MNFEMGWNRFNLMLLGVWPEPRRISIRSSLISNLIFWSTAFLTFTFICAPQAAHLILKSTNLDEVIENLSINVPIMFALIKLIVLRYHKKALATLVGQILDDWSEPITNRERETMLKNARISRKISISSSIMSYVMVSTFIFLQSWTNLKGSSVTGTRGLLHPVTLPYDHTRSPNFEITWLGQFIPTILTSISYSCFDTFLATLVLHLCGQLNVLRLKLEEIVHTTRKNNFSMFYQQLGSIVHRHNQLARYAVVVEDCFNLTLLIQTLICTAMFCLTGYRMMTSVNQEEEDVPIVGLIFFIIHVIYTVLHLFIDCYVGEILLGNSTRIGQSAYYSNWYNLPSKQAVSLIIVICRAETPFQITAGKFSPFSFELFNAVLKTSAGYLSVLLAMKDRLVEET